MSLKTALTSGHPGAMNTAPLHHSHTLANKGSLYESLDTELQFYDATYDGASEWIQILPRRKRKKLTLALKL